MARSILNVTLIAGVLLCIAVTNTVSEENGLIFIIQEEDVYIYHDRWLERGEGFNIYRQDDTDAEYIQLNEDPVRGAQRSDEFLSMVGSEIFEEVREMLRQPNLIMTFRNLRRDEFMATTIGSAIPEVAQAIGFLYIDEDAPVNQTVSYRIEIVDEFDRPTGETFSETVTLSPFRVNPPVDLEAANDRRHITISWHYPIESGVRNEYAVHFNVYRINPGTGDPERLNEQILFRNFEDESYQLSFTAPSLNTVEQYFVTAVDPSGRESEPSETLSFEVVDRTPPSIVRDVDARVTPNDVVQVTWPVSVDPDVAGYYVYRADDMNDEYVRLNDELLDVLETVYLDTTVVGRNSYFYRVSAVDESGNEGERSNAAMAIVERRPPPPAPAAVFADYDEISRTVDLQWEIDHMPDNLETFIVLRRRVDDRRDRPFTQIHHDNIRTTELIDDGEPGGILREGATFEYAVLSSNYSRTFSDTVFTELQVPNITPPDPPRNFRALNDEGFRAELSWNATTSTDADHYRVYRKQINEDEFLEIGHIPVTQRRMRDEDIQRGETYVYAVSAVDTSGNESELTTPDTLLIKSSSPPRQVRNVQARTTDEGIELAWEEVTSLDVTGYIVYRSDDPTGRYERVHEGVLTETGFIDNDGTADHWYRVRAVNSSGIESRRAREVRARR